MTLRRIPCWRLRLSGAVAAIASAALVAVCARPTALGAFAQEAAPCAVLAGRSVEPALIGLRSGPARMASATVERLPASPAAAEPTIAYCKVLGEIAPLRQADPAAVSLS